MSVKGPERGAKPQYFKDPALDSLYQMVLVLGEEVAAMREQLDAMTAIHGQGGTPTAAALDDFDPGERYAEIRQAFVERLLEPLEDLIERETAD